MILYTQNKHQITIDDVPISSGGQGSIHHVLSPVFNPTMVAKVYSTQHKAKAAQQRIEYMSNNNPFLKVQQMVRDSFAWPQESIYDNTGNFVGFMMYFVQNSNPLWHLTISKGFSNPAWLKFNISGPNSYNTRLRVLYNISQALDVLDQSAQYRVIDLKPSNMMLKENGHLTIIDCDSFQISKGTNVMFHTEAATEEYCPPEFHQKKIDFVKQFVESSWDYFSFGVTAYQILFCIHPFNATHPAFQTQAENIQHGLFVHGRNKGKLQIIPPPHNNFNTLLSKPLRDLFMRCFDDGHTNPGARPNFREWRDCILSEILRINNQQITAGLNQPQPRPRLRPKIQTIASHNQLQPQSVAIINSFTISPGGVNLAMLNWNVSQATCVYVDGISVGAVGNMQVTTVSGVHQIEAVDLNGVKTSQTLNFIMPVAIKQFEHQICNGFIMLMWDVNGASSIVINQNTVAASGSVQIPLALGSHSIVAKDQTGFEISQDIHIKCLAWIKDFHYNLLRTAAELEWEVLNTNQIELNGVKVSPIDNKPISLKQNTYKLEVTDVLGNTDSMTLTLNISAQVNSFDIVPGKYTAKATWDIWYVRQALFETENILLQGDKIIPLLNKTFTLHLKDFNGISTDVCQKLNVPDFVPLMSVAPINDLVKQLLTPNSLCNTIDSIQKAEQKFVFPNKINLSLVPTIRKVSSLKSPIVMSNPITKNASKSNKIRFLESYNLLSKAASVIGLISAFLANKIINN